MVKRILVILAMFLLLGTMILDDKVEKQTKEIKEMQRKVNVLQKNQDVLFEKTEILKQLVILNGDMIDTLVYEQEQSKQNSIK